MHRPRFNACSVICRCHDQELTFDQFRTRTEQYAKALAGAGVQVGEIVPICTEPSIEGVILFFALNRLGAVSTFLNSTASAQEILAYTKSYQARLILLSAKCAQRLQGHRLSGIGGVEKGIVISSEESTAFGAYIYFSQLLHESVGVPVELDACGREAPAHISYTSGTTGLPKAILLSNGNIMAEMLSLLKATMMQFGPKGNLMQVVPFNYPYGFIISVLLPILAGKTAALTPKLTLKNISEYLALYEPRYINGIPSFYKAMRNDPAICNMDLSFIQYPVTGGDTMECKMEQELNLFFESHGSKGRISNGCGNGEGCGSLLNPASVIYKTMAGSCGRPIPGLSVKLIDDKTGLPVPIGASGRFCFSGTNVMMGYYEDPDATDKAFYYDEDGRKWFYTDTFMHMEKSQWMFMHGRERRFFITFDEMGSPYKVYCDYVQKVLAESVPEIADCAVVQRPDETRSYVPVAFLCLKEDSDWGERFIRDVKEKCRQKLQRCAVPVEFLAIPEMPLTIAGKVDYHALEQKLQKESERNYHAE